MNSILSALFSASQISNKLKLPDIWQFRGFYRSSICKQILEISVKRIHLKVVFYQ